MRQCSSRQSFPAAPVYPFSLNSETRVFILSSQRNQGRGATPSYQKYLLWKYHIFEFKILMFQIDSNSCSQKKEIYLRTSPKDMAIHVQTQIGQINPSCISSNIYFDFVYSPPSFCNSSGLHSDPSLPVQPANIQGQHQGEPSSHLNQSAAGRQQSNRNHKFKRANLVFKYCRRSSEPLNTNKQKHTRPPKQTHTRKHTINTHADAHKHTIIHAQTHTQTSSQ